MSNKTPKDQVVKIVSVLKTSAGRTVLAGIVFVVTPILIWGYVNMFSKKPVDNCNQLAGLKTKQVTGDDFKINAYVTEDKVRGLGGVTCLEDNDGMLFVYDAPGNYCYWMKDMLINIDMIWLDAQKTIINIKENVAPESYPEYFCPSSPAKYVLETNAGKASVINLKVGDTVKF